MCRLDTELFRLEGNSNSPTSYSKKASEITFNTTCLCKRQLFENVKPCHHSTKTYLFKIRCLRIEKQEHILTRK